jgi:hypothetical protein
MVGVANGTAEVELSPSTSISADRLPMAVGQVVMSLTSVPGVARVVLLSSGTRLQVPLPGGALTTRAVTSADYGDLLVDRYRRVDDRSGRHADLAPGIGCRS